MNLVHAVFVLSPLVLVLARAHSHDFRYNRQLSDDYPDVPQPDDDQGDALLTQSREILGPDGFWRERKQFTLTRRSGSSKSENGVPEVSMEEDIRARLIGSSQICRRVCNFCDRVTSRSVAALCRTQCTRPAGGRAFMACLTFWTIRHDLL